MSSFYLLSGADLRRRRVKLLRPAADSCSGARRAGGSGPGPLRLGSVFDPGPRTASRIYYGPDTHASRPARRRAPRPWSWSPTELALPSHKSAPPGRTVSSNALGSDRALGYLILSFRPTVPRLRPGALARRATAWSPIAHRMLLARPHAQPGRRGLGRLPRPAPGPASARSLRSFRFLPLRTWPGWR